MNTQGVPFGGTGVPPVPPRTFVLRANPKLLIILLCILVSIIAHNPGIGLVMLGLFWWFGWPYQEEMVVARVEY
jgi:energy-coupling factor transporter transmembrane protein EcfT